MMDKSPWDPGKGPKNVFENLFFEKSIGKCVGCEASLVPSCRLVYMVAQFEVERWEKMWGYVAGVGEFENGG